MITYIYLSNEDKNKLCKLAQSKQLSLSACVDIIAENLSILLAKVDTYINKGNNTIKLKIKEKALWEVNNKMATNCVYAYFHEETLSFFPNKNGIKNLKRKIQSTMDKRYDENYMKNIIIRQTYRINKGQLA